MSVSNVVSLLGALRKAGSPLTKAKLLALTVRGVRQLSGEERRELLSRLGVDKTDWFVDRLGDETNETTAELVRELIQQAEKTEPSKWKDLATRLRDPEERRRLLEEGLEMLHDLPDAEESKPAAVEPPAPVPSQPATYSWEEPKPRQPEAAAAKPEPAETEPTKPPAAPATKSPPPVAAAKRAGPHPEKPVPEVPAQPAKSVPDAAAPTPVLRPSPPARTAKVPAARTPSPPSPSVGERAVERRQASRVDARPEKKRSARVKTGTETPTSDLATDLTATGSLVRRLRLLKERCGEAESLSAEQLRRLVEVFPAGWARRRALSALLTAGLPADFDAALGLVVETLESPTDRRWCLGSLAGGRDLTPDQREALLASLESPGWRRRLSRRLAAGIAD